MFRENIDAATAEKYGDPPGPTYEALRKTKSGRQIIESASRPIEYPDDRLTPGVRAWFEKSKEKEKDE